jgi:cytochrome c553
MRNFFHAILGLAVTVGSSGWAVAQEPGERERLAGAVAKVMHDAQSHEAAIRAGRERTLLCSQCHGETGNSVSPEIPNLAGQNPAYLLQQIEKFADGRRKNFVMRSLARSFTFEDKVNLAIYFSSMEVKPHEADRTLAAKGEPIFQTVCQACHGENGRGEQGYARLAGQRVKYVENTLKRFRDNAHMAEAQAEKTARHSVPMERVVQDLTDEQIAALANYIALLK